MERYHCDYILGAYLDAFNPMVALAAHGKQDDEKVFGTVIPTLLKEVEKRIDAPGKWLTGDKISVADFCIGAYYVDLFIHPKPKYGKKGNINRWTQALEKSPKFENYGKQFVEENKEWLSKRPTYSF